MRVLLINPNDEIGFSLFVLDDYNTEARSYQPPMGLLYLHSYLKDKHDVKILDMPVRGLKIKDIGAEIETFEPDIIGITCVIGKVLTVNELVREIAKNRLDIPIVLGGVNPSLYPWETLQNPFVSYVVAGFGQVPFGQLCDAIENFDNTDNIPNVYSWTNCNDQTTGHFEFVDIDEFPIPDRSVLPIEDYQMPFAPENPTTSMVSSLGCPHKCAFCACKNFKPVTIRTPENIVAEMKHVESIGIRSVLFQDELFTMSTKRIREICSLIVSEGVNLNWSVRSRANLVNREALEMMRDAGCFNIHFGIESGTDRILGEMNKRLTVDVIRKSVEMVKSVGIGCTASFMLGYPDETEDEIMQTIQFAKDLELDVAQFYVTQPEPKTELYEQVKIAKGLPDDIYSEFVLNGDENILKNNLASNLFTKDELEGFMRFAYSQVRSLYDVKKESK